MFGNYHFFLQSVFIEIVHKNRVFIEMIQIHSYLVIYFVVFIVYLDHNYLKIFSIISTFLEYVKSKIWENIFLES